MLFWCTVFATAFGVIEGAVVVYLREIVHPEGFSFPLKEIAPSLLATELGRELATIVALAAVARLAVTGGQRRFAVFAFCFGVWDLAYYVMLKVCLDWPVHIMDWDILFLIPLPWTSPVLAPVLVSLSLIGAGVALLRVPEIELRPRDWAIEIVAGLVIIGSFLWNVPAVERHEVPASYPWWLFGIGWLGGISWFLLRLGAAKRS